MKQSKTVQKLDSKIALVSQDMCQLLTAEFSSFKSLQHTVKFDHFPGSLLFDCFFENSNDFETIKSKENYFQKKLHQLLFKKGILLKNPTQNLRFITKTC